MTTRPLIFEPMFFRPALLVFCMFYLACSKPSTGVSENAVAAATPVASAASSAAPANAVVTWRGTYKATAGSLYVPDGGEWAGTKWHGDDASTEAIGDGTLTLEVKAGIVTGSIDGPLGPAIISGTLDGEFLSARIDRKDPSDRGLVGVLDGTVKDGAATGEMHLSSLVNARLLRQATFELKRGS